MTVYRSRGAVRDNPIGAIAQDALGREEFARVMAAAVADAAEEGGAVIALTGPWGSGKSSLLNMIDEALADDVTVVRFNPWLFSGTEELVGRFFDEIGAQLAEADAIALKTVGNQLRRFGRLLSPLRFAPVIGRTAEVATTVASELGDALSEGPSLETQRTTVRRQLAQGAYRIVVMVDDIDRLEDDEIAQIMKLVRLVGDFPGVVYLLSYDADRVEAVLSSGGRADGARFLEKIVQLSQPVPATGRDDLHAILTGQVDRALIGALEPRRSDVGAIIAQVVPLVSTVRGIRRYGSVVSLALRLNDDVLPADVLAMEAIRLFCPQLDDELSGIMESVSVLLAEDARPEEAVALQTRLDSLLGDTPVRGLVTQVFGPLGRVLAGEAPTLDADREMTRVANPERYFEYLQRRRSAGSIGRPALFEIVEQLSETEALGPLIDDLDDARFRDLLAKLPGEIEQRELSDTEVSVGAVTLLHRAAATRTSTGYIAKSATVRAALDALFSALPRPERCAVVNKIADDLDDRIERYFFLTAMIRGDAPNIPCAEQLRDRIGDDIATLECDEARGQRALAYMLQWIARQQQHLAKLHELLADDQVLLQFAATFMRDTTLDPEIELHVSKERLARLLPALEAADDTRSRRALQALKAMMPPSLRPIGPSEEPVGAPSS